MAKKTIFRENYLTHKPNGFTPDEYEKNDINLDSYSFRKENNKKKNKEEQKESRNMAKKLIRLTESDLHRIVKESVQRILRESSLDADYMSDFWHGLGDDGYEPQVDLEKICKEADDDLKMLWKELKQNGFKVSNITNSEGTFGSAPTFKVKTDAGSRYKLMDIVNSHNKVSKFTDGNITTIVSNSGDYRGNYDEKGYERFSDDENNEPPTMQQLLRGDHNVSTWGSDVNVGR